MFDIQKAKELCEKATQGPWTPVSDGGALHYYRDIRPAIHPTVIHQMSGETFGLLSISQPNAEFIAKARILFPEAIAEIERLRALLTKASSAMGNVPIPTAGHISEVFWEIDKEMETWQ